MTEAVKVKIEADTEKFKKALRKFATEILIPAIKRN